MSNPAPITGVFGLSRAVAAVARSGASCRIAHYAKSDRDGSRPSRTAPRSSRRVVRRWRNWRLAHIGTERQLKRRKSSAAQGEKVLTARRGRGILSKGSWPVSGSELFLDSPTSTTGCEPVPCSSLKSDKRSRLFFVDTLGRPIISFLTSKGTLPVGDFPLASRLSIHYCLKGALPAMKRLHLLSERTTAILVAEVLHE